MSGDEFSDRWKITNHFSAVQKSFFYNIFLQGWPTFYIYFIRNCSTWSRSSRSRLPIHGKKYVRRINITYSLEYWYIFDNPSWDDVFDNKKSEKNINSLPSRLTITTLLRYIVSYNVRHTAIILDNKVTQTQRGKLVRKIGFCDIW